MSLKRVISPGKPALIALAVLAAVSLMNPLPATAADKEGPSLPTLMASFDQGVNLIASAQHYTQRQRSLLASVERQAQRLVGDLGTNHGHLAATQNRLDLLATQSTSNTQEGEQLLVEYTRQQGRMKLIQQSLADDRALLEGVRKSVQALEKTTAPLRGDIERQLTARALSRLKEASYQLQTLRENQLDSAIRSRLEHTLLAGMVGRSESFAHEIVSASQECREIQAALNQQRTEINQLTDRLAALRSGFEQSVSVFAEVVEGFMESQSALLKSALELGPTAADLEAMPLRDINDFAPATERNHRGALSVPEPESRYGGVEGSAKSGRSSDYDRGMAAPSASKVPDTVSEEVIALNKKAEWYLDRLERLLGLADTTLARDQTWRAAAESWRQAYTDNAAKVAEMRGVISRQKLLQELNTRQASDIAGQVDTIATMINLANKQLGVWSQQLAGIRDQLQAATQDTPAAP